MNVLGCKVIGSTPAMLNYDVVAFKNAEIKAPLYMLKLTIGLLYRVLDRVKDFNI